MAILFPQIRSAQITGARRGGDDHRRTGAVVLKAAGTSLAEAFTTHAIALGYVGSDGTSYTDTVPVDVLPLVWTPDTRPPTDPHYQDPLTHTLAVANTVHDAHSANWRYFCQALYGGTVTHLFAARTVDFDGYAAQLEALTTSGDVLRVLYSTAHFPRPSQGGCNVCGDGIGRRAVQLVAGTPALVDPHPGSIPPTDPDNYVPTAGYDDASGNPKLAKLASPICLAFYGSGVYIGCGAYTSNPGNAPSGTIRLVQGGGISTLWGVGDTGLLPFGTMPPNFQIPPTTMLIRPDPGDPTNITLDFMVAGPGASAQFSFLQEGDPCSIVVTASTVSQFGALGQLAHITDPVSIGNGTIGGLRTWTMTNNGRPWVIEDNVTPAVWGLGWGYGMQRTSAGRLLGGGMAQFSVTGVGTDGATYRHASALPRIDDITNPGAVGELVWSYNLRESISGGGVSGNCPAHLRYILGDPRQEWLDQDRYLYVADRVLNQILMYDLQTDTMRLVIGAADGSSGFAGDGKDALTLHDGQVKLAGPQGVCVDSQGNLIIADTGNACIRRVNMSTGIIKTVAGVPTHGGWHQWNSSTNDIVPGSALKLGPALTTQLNFPTSVYPSKNCGIYICDTQNHRVIFLGCGSPV